MQKGKIKAGVIYGFANSTSDYRSASPVIVLDAKTLWTWSRQARGGNTVWKVSNEKRYSSPIGGWSSYYGAHGYLILSGSNYQSQDRQAQHLQELKALYAEFAETAGNPDAVNALAEKVRHVEGISLTNVNNRWIIGEYTEAKNEENEREKAREAKRKTERERANAEAAFMAEASEIISTKLERPMNLSRDYSYDGKRASISFNDLAAFLGIKTPGERL